MLVLLNDGDYVTAGGSIEPGAAVRFDDRGLAYACGPRDVRRGAIVKRGRDSVSPAVAVAIVAPATRCPSCDSTAIARRTPDAPWHCPVCSWCRHELSAPPAAPRFAVGAWVRDVTRPTDCGQVMSASNDGEPMYLVCRENESSNFWVRERDCEARR